MVSTHPEKFAGKVSLLFVLVSLLSICPGSAVLRASGPTDAANGINFLEYFPLRIGEVQTYDDGAQSVIASTRELDWVDVPAYEKIWATNPNEDYGDAAVADYFAVRNDSLFWVGHFWVDNEGTWEFHHLTSPGCLGTSNMTSGQVIVSQVVMENENEGDTQEMEISVRVESVGTVTVTAGTYTDCIKLTESIEGETMVEWTLARGVGVIKGTEIDVTTDSEHSLVEARTGGYFDVHEYFPLDEDRYWTYEDGSQMAMTGTTEFTFYPGPIAEFTWVRIPDPEIPDGETRSYYAQRGDSLFWVAHYVNEPGWDSPEYFALLPPLFFGTSATPLGVSVKSSGLLYDVPSGEWSDEDPWEMEMIFVPVGTVTTPAGTFNNCIKGLNVINNWLADIIILAPDVGMIAGKYKQEMDLQQLIGYGSGEPPEPEGNIDVPAYFPLRLGDIYCYDDGSQAAMASIRELRYTGVSAYEKIWTLNPNQAMDDATCAVYFFVSGDSLFWAAHRSRERGQNGYWIVFDPPVLLGTGSTSSGQQFTTELVARDYFDSTTTENAVVTVTVTSAGTVTVPTGSYDDCIRILAQRQDGEQSFDLILAKGLGVIEGEDLDLVRPDGLERHGLVLFQPAGQTVDMLTYFPLDEGSRWTFNTGAEYVSSGQVEVDFSSEPLFEYSQEGMENKQYFLIRKDSLYWSGNYAVSSDNVETGTYYDPGWLFGTGETLLGKTILHNNTSYNILTGEVIAEEAMVGVLAVPVFNQQVPAGSFENCIKLIRINAGGWSNWWYILAEDTGRIMEGYNGARALTDFEMGFVFEPGGGGNWTNYTIEDGLTGEQAYWLTMDSDNNILVATNDGWSRWNGIAWSEDLSFEGTPDDATSGLRDSQGNWWLGTEEHGVWKGDGTGWINFTESAGLPEGEVAYILQDRQGNMWFSINGAGVCKYDGASWRLYTTADGLCDIEIHMLAEDSKGNIWCASSEENGVSRFDGTNWYSYTVAHGLADNEIYGIGPGANGEMWFSTGNESLSRFDGYTWTTYTTDDGFVGSDCYYIFMDSKGNMWFCIEERGVNKFDGTSWTRYSTLDGLASNEVYYGIEDNKGNLWFGTDNGVSVLAAESEGVGCDFNGDGKITISDVISLLLYMRNNPGDLKADFNGDGKVTVSDAISMLLAMRDGTCPDALAMLSSAVAGDGYLEAGKLEGLTSEETGYLGEIMASLGLTPEEQAAFRLALYGRTAAAELPRAFSLEQNVPNPFNPATTISYSVPEGSTGLVTLKVYDIRGTLVRVLVNELREAGTYTVFWDGTGRSGERLSSGVYFYRLQAGDFIQTRKMVLLK